MVANLTFDGFEKRKAHNITRQRMTHLLQDDNLVTLGSCAEAVGHKEGGAAGGQGLQRLQDLLLCARVQRTCGLITQQDSRIL